MGAANIYKIILNEGFRTFNYLIKEKLNGRKSEQDRYRDYITYDEPNINEKYLCDCQLDYMAIVQWDNNSTCKTLLKEVCQCQEEYIGLKHTDILLHKNAITIMNNYIYRLKKRDITIDVFYGSEDTIEPETKKRSNPVFKPEFSPDTLMSFNYIGDFACIRRTVLLDCLNHMNEDSNEILYEVLLRLSLNKEIQFGIINTILTHNIQTKENRLNSDLASLKENILKEHSIKASVINNNKSNQIQYVDYEYNNELISIIIPSKDNPELLTKCIESIKNNTNYANYEIVVIDNGSSSDNEAEYRRILGEYGSNTKYIYEPMDFNFSRMCNIGACSSSGNIFLFLNDDIEILSQENCTDMCRDWLEIMAAQALRKETGAVGAKLMYPDSNKIQHIGVVNYENAGLAHIYARHDDDDSIKDYRNLAVYNYFCVTGACLMVEKSKFDMIHGFNEKLQVTHNDIELCFNLFKNGLYQVQRNDVVLIHHESFSRGIDEENKEKELRNMKERDILYSLYPDYEKYDPYYSPCLSQLEFESKINRDIYSVIYHKPEKADFYLFSGRQNTGKVCRVKADVTSCKYKEDLQIRGYIYKDNGKEKQLVNPDILIYNDKNTYIIKAISICDRVFHKRKGIDRHINYAPFFCGVNTIDMEGGQYSIGLYSDKVLIDTNNIVTI